MKKRLKGLLVLWLAFLMVVSTPMTANAATVNDVYYYTGTEALVSDNCYKDEVVALGASGFEVDKSLKEQFSGRIPAGYSVTGWNLWKATSGFYVSDAYKLQPEGTITQQDFNTHFTSSNDYNEDINYAIVEPVLKLDYEITNRPTNEEPYVVINDAGAKAEPKYQWYKIQTANANTTVTTGSKDENDEGIFKSCPDYELKFSISGLSQEDSFILTPVDGVSLNLETTNSGWEMGTGDGNQLTYIIVPNEEELSENKLIMRFSYSSDQIDRTRPFSVEITNQNVTSSSYTLEIIDGLGSFDKEKGTLTAGISMHTLRFEVDDMTEGNILQVVSKENKNINLSNQYSGLTKIREDNEVGIWSFKIQGARSELQFSSNEEFTVKVDERSDVQVEGANDATFSGDNGNYYCAVTFNNGATVNSDEMKYVRYRVGVNPPTNGSGSYILQVNGKDIIKVVSSIVENPSEEEIIEGVSPIPEEPSGEEIIEEVYEGFINVIPNDTITMVPEEGYNLKATTVVNSDDGSTEVEVNNNSFTMPDYPVTISVTLQKETYEVKLPEDVAGYTVSSPQTSPVDHGSDYSFTVTLKEEYIASDSFLVKANDNTLTATDVNGNVYTFTIESVTQAQNITITGVEQKKYGITKSETTGGSFTVKANNSEVSAAVKDTAVTIEMTPAVGYELDKITVIHMDGSDTAVIVDDENKFTMPSYPVTVKVTFKKITYAITLPPEAEGYTVKSDQASSVEHGDSYAFTVTIREGYVASADFEVQANSAKLTATKTGDTVYNFTIENVTSEQIVTVSGVKDGTAPVIKITLDEYTRWQNFQSAISLGRFYKEEKSLTITATDNVSKAPSIMYYMANTDLFPENNKVYKADEIEAKITKWTEYTKAIPLAEDGTYVLYAKAADEAKNVSYASTIEIVVDTKAPAITGIKDDCTYYGDIPFTVSDDNLDVVKIDDSSVQPDEGTYKITADNKSHTVEAVDLAGNSVRYKIVVNKKYDITLPTETTGYKLSSYQESSVGHGDSYSFSVEIQAGYKATEKYAVQVKDKAIEPIKYGINAYYYTIDSVTEPLSISVIGVNKLHEIAISETDNGGSYTVTAEDESDVTTAVMDTKLTIIPSPAEGYELDKISVVQQDGESTAVAVNDMNQFTMPDYPVSVGVTFRKKTYGITVPKVQTGYTVTSSQTSPVEHGSDYTFKVTISDGYDVPTALSVKANGHALVATGISGKEYTYTLEKVAAAQEITVDGVSDIVGPEVTIAVDEANIWKQFLINIGFGLFFQEEKQLTIDAVDTGSGRGSVMYYVSETDLFPAEETYAAKEIEKRIPQWTEYSGAVSISVDRSYVVYARATDIAGNVTYVSTSGMVIDTTKPVISGLEDGGQYYDTTSATISDANLSSVKLDGKAVEFTGTSASVTITADGEQHTIEAKDKAGNQTSYKVTVSETWVRDGISSAGSRVLKLGVPYKFGNGKWKVAGDTTVYEGGNTFYASEGGTFEFQTQ